MEVNVIAEAIMDVELPRKLEMDLSYEKGNNSRESGVYSNESGSIASANVSWECFLDEVADPNVFDPPIMNSSGIKNLRIPCSVSTIEGTLASSRIGKSCVSSEPCSGKVYLRFDLRFNVYSEKYCNSTSITDDSKPDESSKGLIFGFLTESKAEIFATVNDWKSEMHVSKLEGSWNETSSDFKLKFPSSTDLFDNRMMPKEKLSVANDIDLKMAVTVSDKGNLFVCLNQSREQSI